MPPEERSPAQLAAAIGIPGVERHVLLCVDEDCDVTEESWRCLKRRLREQGLERRRVHATQARCLGICSGGPIMVVHPDGTWYRDVTPANVDRIVRGHLAGDEPVEDLVFVSAPLGPKA